MKMKDEGEKNARSEEDSVNIQWLLDPEEEIQNTESRAGDIGDTEFHSFLHFT